MNGTIHKRQKANGRPAWAYIFDAGKDTEGKRRQITKSGYATKAEASEALRVAIAAEEAKRDASSRPAVPTFAVFVERWMDEHAVRKCAPKTVERYRELAQYAIRHLVADVAGGSPQAFGAMTIDAITPMHVDLMLNTLLDHGGAVTKANPAGRPLSVKSVRHIIMTIHGILEKAVRWQLIARNPVSGVELPKPTKKPPSAIEKGGVGKLLDRARETKLYPFILLGLATGARRGELLALTWSDVDFESGLLNISKSLEQTRAGLRVKSTKSKRPRRFAIPAAALKALQESRVEQDRERSMFGSDYQENNLVFCRFDGAYYSPVSMGGRVSEMMKSAGLFGVSLHSLRHTHASELLSKGVPIPTVAKRLGHANANVTLSIYAHALEADEMAAAKIWDDAMADVISASRKTAAERMLANVSAKPVIHSQVIKNTGRSMERATGIEPV